MKNKTKIYLALLFMMFCQSSLYAQTSASEVSKLKKTERELWYLDQKPPKEAFSVDSSKLEPTDLRRFEEIVNPEISENLVTFLQWLFFGILAAAIIFLFAKSKFNLNFRTKNNPKVNEIITEETKIESLEQLEQIGFAGQIEKAEKDNNFRLAVRLYYLWLIHKLVSNKLIKFHINKTNRQYLNEMRNNKLLPEFEDCTKYYNFVWFGEFEIDNTIYQKIATHYKHLLGQLIW